MGDERRDPVATGSAPHLTPRPGREGGALQRVVVVGASLAGVAAAEELRRRGFDGELVLVGDEERLPYDRPPLSKDVLAGRREPDATLLRPASLYDELEVELALGRPATGLDLARRRVRLGDTTELAFDGLVIATGAAPVMLGGPRLDGVHPLRTLEDCLAIRERLSAARRVVIVGGGFIGAEVAATAVAGGAHVTLLEGLPQPMSRVLGLTIGELCATMHREHGVDVRCSTTVAGLVGQDVVQGVRLRDGTVVEADLVVVGIGVRPSTGWLEGSGLELADGVVCDPYCRSSHPSVVAAGDVARWTHPTLGAVRIEHWENAIRQGQAAASTLLSPEHAEVYAPVPYVWSDQYDRKIQIVGRPADGDEMVVVDGSLEERRFVVLYGRAGVLTAGLAFNRSRPIRLVRDMLATGTRLAEAVASFAERQAAKAAPPISPSTQEVAL
jgi:3-phenylpropionate/trans-cinnamate dioxygenase ferredoxin reductase subunit